MMIADHDIDTGDADDAAEPGAADDEYRLVHAPATHVGELPVPGPAPAGTADGDSDNPELRHWTAALAAMRRALGRKF